MACLAVLVDQIKALYKQVIKVMLYGGNRAPPPACVPPSVCFSAPKFRGPNLVLNFPLRRAVLAVASLLLASRCGCRIAKYTGGSSLITLLDAQTRMEPSMHLARFSLKTNVRTSAL
jgi:hypothetical protein